MSAVGLRLPISFKRKVTSQKPIIIGLPKGLFYFQHHMLWENFLKNIGCQVVVSEDTNKDIMDYGVKHCSNETCLPVKVFHGHVYALKDKVDYIFIPRYTSVDKNEYACPKFAGLPDMTLLNLKKQVKILEVKLHLHNSLQQTHESLKDISNILNIRYKHVEDAFMKALNLYDDNQKANVVNTISNGHPKISVLGHPYMIYDNYLSMRLINKLKERNINVLTPASLEHKTNRVGGHPLFEWPTSHSTVRTVRYTALPKFTLTSRSNIPSD